MSAGLTEGRVRIADLPAREPLPAVAARRIMGAQAMVQEVRLAAGAGAPRHAHPNEQIVIVLEGRLSLALGDGAAEELDTRKNLPVTASF
jgi:quercetin dioxygenase-like cupin family protein